MTSTPLAFVAGATGYTGRAVVAALRAAGVRTVAHVRPGSSGAAAHAQRFAAVGAEVDGTPWEPAAMRATLARLRPDHVFALLGTTRRRAAREGLADPYERIDYGLTRTLLDAATAAGSAPRFTYLSALGASETSGNPYLRVRGRLERELREGPLPWLVAQPAFVTGGGGNQGGQALRAGLSSDRVPGTARGVRQSHHHGDRAQRRDDAGDQDPAAASGQHMPAGSVTERACLES